MGFVMFNIIKHMAYPKIKSGRQIPFINHFMSPFIHADKDSDLLNYHLAKSAFLKQKKVYFVELYFLFIKFIIKGNFFNCALMLLNGLYI